MPRTMGPSPAPDEAALDLELIARWRAGDELAASQLVARHAEPLASFAARLVDRDEVPDLVQDTFLRAFGALEGFRGDSAWRTWLFAIARRLVVDRRRASGRRGVEVGVEDDDIVTQDTPLDGVIAREASERMRAALGRLTRLQREVFLLRVQEGMAYRDIAAIVGSTEGAARVHYHNAMRVVRERHDD